ncbi:MAG: hypothetical protein ACMG6S_29495 [Byssovorax sp.]
MASTTAFQLSKPFLKVSPVGGAPIRNAEDARTFMAWIDRLVTAASEHRGWNSPEERALVLARLKAARQVFSERASP